MNFKTRILFELLQENKNQKPEYMYMIWALCVVLKLVAQEAPLLHTPPILMTCDNRVFTNYTKMPILAFSSLLNENQKIQ